MIAPENSLPAVPVPPPDDDAPLRFPALAALRLAHADLLKRQRESAGAAELRGEIEAFIRRGRATGALLDESDDRWDAQSILDYWATFIFRADRTTVDATLDEFDSELAPQLDDADCPYVGLDAFREQHVEIFFGRQRLIQSMIERLGKERFLAVVGPSGSGKSSVMLAGVLPALRAGALPQSVSWRYLPPIVPGPDPLGALARVVAAAGGEAGAGAEQAARLREDPRSILEMLAGEDGAPCILVIDQFEEVFTLCEDGAARQAFADALTALVEAPGLWHTVLLTMRSDYESRVAQLGDFQALFERAQVRVTPLSSPELRDAILRPAELVGLKFEEGLVDDLLRDILGEPAGLPLLQFTLLKLWQSRERNWVTREAYRRLGGGRQALARSADELYAALIPEEQVTARRILLRMVRPSEGLEVTSSRVRRQDLHRGGEDPGRVNRVLDKLVAAYLVRRTMSRGEELFEVAHEALVRNWPTLVEWLEEERTEINTRRRLEWRVEEWLQGKGGLLDEAQLREAERWLGSSSASLLGYRSELPALVEASRKAIEEGKRRDEASRRFRALAALMGMLFLVTLLVVLGVSSALREEAAARSEADHQESLAKKAAATAQRQKILTERALLKAIHQQQVAAEALREAGIQRDLAQGALSAAGAAKKRAEAEKKRAEAEKERAKAEKERAEDALADLKEQQETADMARAEVSFERMIADLGTELFGAQQPETEQPKGRRVLELSALLGFGSRVRPLQIGASIGEAQGLTGSLCCVVRDKTGQHYLLSLPDVFESEPGTPILQPSRSDGGSSKKDRIAAISRSTESGAIARIDPDVEVESEIQGIGRIRGVKENISKGDIVLVVGRASGIVEVEVYAAEPDFASLAIPFRMGDLGAAVLSEDGELVGLLSLHDDTLQTIIVPIAPILKELEVELVTE